MGIEITLLVLGLPLFALQRDFHVPLKRCVHLTRNWRHKLANLLVALGKIHLISMFLLVPPVCASLLWEKKNKPKRFGIPHGSECRSCELSV